MSGIFISYRREDGATAARRLYERLVARFGAESVFIDVETIEVGDEFGQVIEEKVGFCDAVIAVIGPRWLTAGDPTGRRRLDDPRDWVRREIVAALRGGIKVFPVLVEGAALPRAGDLPRDLAKLGEHQALDLRAERFDRDLERLLAALERLLRRGNAANLWLSILARGHRALDPLDLHRPETVWRALRFAMFMTLAGAVIRLPTIAFAGERSWSPVFLATYLAANYIEWLAAAVILHLAMKALGGRGTVAKSIAAVCFLSAYLPVIGLAQIPVWGLHVSVLKDVADVAWSPAMAHAALVQFTERLGSFGVIRVVMAFGVASALWLILAAGTFSALRSLHRVGRARALLAFGLGLAGYMVFLAVFYGPLVGAAYRALERG
jgi:hypothetical protein